MTSIELSKKASESILKIWWHMNKGLSSPEPFILESKDLKKILNMDIISKECYDEIIRSCKDSGILVGVIHPFGHLYIDDIITFEKEKQELSISDLEESGLADIIREIASQIPEEKEKQKAKVLDFRKGENPQHD